MSGLQGGRGLLSSKSAGGGGALSGASLPVNITLPSITGTPAVGSVLTRVQGVWATPVPPNPTYAGQWTNNGSNIGGATATTYTVQAGDDGDAIAYKETCIGANGSTTATSASVTAYAPAAPVNSVAPVVTSSNGNVIGAVLTCTTGTWTGTPTPTYGRQWERNGSPISGAISSSYTTTFADDGADITCVVTGTNAGGSATATSNSIDDFVHELKFAVPDATVKAKTQKAYGLTGDKVVYDYTGNSLRLKRVSDSVEANFGFTASGRFDRAAVDTWRAGSAVQFVYPFDQISGAAGPTAMAGYTVINADGTTNRFGTTWNTSTGQNTRHASNGAMGLNLATSQYLELTSSGINVSTNGCEVHMLCSNNLRKKPSVGTDPWSPSTTQEYMWSLGASNTSYLGYRLNGGTNTHWTRRNNGTLASMNTDTGISILKANGQRVFSNYINGATGRRYEAGKITGEKTDFTADHSALDNTTFRIGRGAGADTDYANMLVGAVIVTDGTLTDAERQAIHARLALLGQQHLIRNNTWFEAQFDELFVAKDVNASTGEWIGRKAAATWDLNLTGSNVQLNTAIGNTGYTGFNWPSSDADNWHLARTNYFTDVHTGSMMAVYLNGEAELHDVLSIANGVGDADNTTLSLGRNHTSWRMITSCNDTADPIGYANKYGMGDSSGGKGSQPHLKYGDRLSNSEWQMPISVGAADTAFAYGISTLLTIGDLMTSNIHDLAGRTYEVSAVDPATNSMASAAMDAALFGGGFNDKCYNVLCELSTTGVLPAGLSAGDVWMRVSLTGVKTFFASSANALANTSVIDITDVGTGTHSIKIKRLVSAQTITGGGGRAPTPELDTYSHSGNTFPPMRAVGDPIVLIGTFKKGASYDPTETLANREPHMKTGTNWLYAAPFNHLPAHLDCGIARQDGWGSVVHSISDGVLQAGVYERSGATLKEQLGGRLLFGLKASEWSAETQDIIRLNLPLFLEAA